MDLKPKEQGFDFPKEIIYDGEYIYKSLLNLIIIPQR